MAAGQLNKIIRHLSTVVESQDAARLTDADLLGRYVQHQEETAFEALVRRHGPMVLGVCRRVLHGLDDAEDAFQATFLVLVRKASTLRSPGMLGNWLYGVAYRIALHARDAAAKRRAKEAKVVAKTETTDDTWTDLRLVLDRELERLSEKYRVVVVLCDLQGKTRKEAAQHLGWAEGTVASRLVRGRALLAKRLGQHGLSITGGALAAALSENAASASLPISLVVATTKTAGLFAAGKTAASGLISAKIAGLTEGALKSMLLSKLKSVGVMILATAFLISSLAAGAGLLMAGAQADGPANAKQDAAFLAVNAAAPAPVPEPKPEEKSKTDPPGAPLEAKLIVKKDTYTLDRRGSTAAEYTDAAKKQPPEDEVDLVLELKNTSDKEITIWIADYHKGGSREGGDYVTLELDLKGPSAISGMVHRSYTRPRTPPPRTQAIAPGKTWALPLTTLNYGTFGVATFEAYRTCWTEPGEYTLTATFKTAVSPKPEGAKETKWANFEGGLVTVTSAPVKLKVVEKGKEPKAKDEDRPKQAAEKKLLGSWKVVSLEMDGKEVADEARLTAGWLDVFPDLEPRYGCTFTAPVIKGDGKKPDYSQTADYEWSGGADKHLTVTVARNVEFRKLYSEEEVKKTKPAPEPIKIAEHAAWLWKFELDRKQVRPLRERLVILLGDDRVLIIETKGGGPLGGDAEHIAGKFDLKKVHEALGNLPASKWVFSRGSSLTARLPQDGRVELAYALGEADQRGTIDIDARDPERSEKIRVYSGIYVIEGDTLKICYAFPGKERPKSFATSPGKENKPGSGGTLVVLKREPRKQEPKEVKNPSQAAWPYARVNVDSVGKDARTWIIQGGDDLPKAMGLPDDDRTAIEYAGFLHKAFKFDNFPFKKHMLVVITGGTQPSDGCRVEVEKVVCDGKTMTIHWKLHRPKGLANPALTHPATVVLVDQFDGEFRFEPPLGDRAKDK